ncbi:MAG TPA: hypothetical protein VNM48_19360 [Chloroflexota bacterium]|nr:hypothetical protein [Chloroflexota bacterium]
MIESWTGRVYSVLRLTREAAPRTAALLLVCYLTLTLAAGAPLRGHLWDAGQHATPHQWRLHTQLAERGANAHHAEYAHDVYHASHINSPFPAGVTVARFQPKPGWQRAGTGRIAATTWSGGRIENGEFDEFVFIARTPQERWHFVNYLRTFARQASQP